MIAILVVYIHCTLAYDKCDSGGFLTFQLCMDAVKPGYECVAVNY